MHAATHDPSRVETTTSGSSLTLILALNDVDSTLGLRRVTHDNFPTTASIAPRSWATVNGLVT